MHSPSYHLGQAQQALSQAARAGRPGDREQWLQIAAEWQALAAIAWRRDQRWAELATRAMLAKLFPGQFDPWSPLPAIEAGVEG